MRHANNFDGLRLVGALFVLYSHMYPLSGRPEPHALPGITFGTLGVYIFFAISGFLVCQSWRADPDAHRFMQRRFLRIWPAMAVALIVTSGALALFGSASFWQFASYMRNLVCLRCDDGVFFRGSPQATLYGSMWTIPLEVQCYLLLMAAGMVARDRLGLLVTAIAALALAPLPFAGDFSLIGYRWPVGFVGALFLGGCLISFHEQLQRRPWVPILGGLALIWHGDYIPAMAFIVPPTAVYVGLRSWPVLRHAGRFGDLSYGIYLYAWPVQQVLVLWLGKETSVWALMGLTLVITTALAYASWHLVEKHALRLKPAASRASGSLGQPSAPGASNPESPRTPALPSSVPQ